MCRVSPDDVNELGTAGSPNKKLDLMPVPRKRRGKRDKIDSLPPTPKLSSPFRPARRKRQSKALQKHGSDAPSGGVEALLPSLAGLVVLVFVVMGKMGFRGRASVAGIDLGTTNSVICVQQQSKGVGEIQCIPDPASESPVIPSVVSFLEPAERPAGPKSKVPSDLSPHPTHVVVGQEAKRRIDSHPHHTLYNAKRVLGRHHTDSAVEELKPEVEFEVSIDEEEHGVMFRVPYHVDARQSMSMLPVYPQQVGSYVVNHLMEITKTFLGHENVKSAVICVPAKFDNKQREATFAAFTSAGVKITRVIEEPTAAALAYGLHKKPGVDHILVYDFGGGTLDISLLYVTEGFVDVMGSDGDDRLGGADFDAAVAHFLLEHRGGLDVVNRVSSVVDRLSHELEETEPEVDFEDELSAKCSKIESCPLCTVSSFHTIGEQLKIGLSDPNNNTVMAECLTLPSDVDEKQLNMEQFCQSLIPTTLTLSTEEFEQVSSNLYDRSVLPIHRLLKDLNLRTDEIDEVVMVGGTTRMPQIRDIVREALPTAQLNTHIDPDITVAYGAASVID